MASVPECCLASPHHRPGLPCCRDLARAIVRARARAFPGSGGRGRSAGSARSGRSDSGARAAGRASTPNPRGRWAPRCCRGTDTSPSIPSAVLHASGNSSSARRRKRGLSVRASNRRAACVARVCRRPAIEAAAPTGARASAMPGDAAPAIPEAHRAGVLSPRRERAGGTSPVRFGRISPSRRTEAHLVGAIRAAGFRPRRAPDERARAAAGSPAARARAASSGCGRAWS